MPTYIIDGKKIRTPNKLSEEQIDQIASELRSKGVSDVEEAPEDFTGLSGFDVKPFGDVSPNFGLKGLKDPIDGYAQLLPYALSKIASGFGLTPNQISKWLENESKRLNESIADEENAYQARRLESGEKGYDFDRTLFNILNPTSFVTALKAVEVAEKAPKTAKTMIAGGVQALGTPVTDEKNQEDFIYDKGKLIAGGTLTGLAGEVAFTGAGKVLDPVVSEAEKLMRDLGVRPTTGQTLGGVAKNIEEFARFLPIVGSKIESQQEKVLYKFNEGLINKALDTLPIPFRNEVPKTQAIGRPALDYAAKQLDQAYNETLKGMKFSLNGTKITEEILDSLNKTGLRTPKARKTVQDYIDNEIYTNFKEFDFMAGKPKGTLEISGEDFKRMDSGLRARIIKLFKNPETLDEAFALESVRKTLKKNFYSQNGNLGKQLAKIDSGYGQLHAMKVAASDINSKSGTFTPNAYLKAIRAGDNSRDKVNFGLGIIPGQSLAEAGKEALGEEGTFYGGREALGMSEQNIRRLATVGTGTAGFVEPTLTIGGIAIGTGVYSETGQEALDFLLRSRSPFFKTLGRTLKGELIDFPYLKGSVITAPVMEIGRSNQGAREGMLTGQ